MIRALRPTRVSLIVLVGCATTMACRYRAWPSYDSIPSNPSGIIPVTMGWFLPFSPCVRHTPPTQVFRRWCWGQGCALSNAVPMSLFTCYSPTSFPILHKSKSCKRYSPPWMETSVSLVGCHFWCSYLRQFQVSMYLLSVQRVQGRHWRFFAA